MIYDIKKRPNNKRILILVAAFLLIILAGAAVFHWSHGQHAEEDVEFPAAYPWRENLEIKKEYVAQIRAMQHIELRSMEKGYLQNIFVDEGQFVKKGQKMFQIMPLLLQADLKKSQAEYQLARIEYDNTLMLHKKTSFLLMN
jgi:membrane fusion protein (multidrug efflux system)